MGCGPKTNSLSIRILLGIPKLSDHIIKTKLVLFYDAHKKRNNVFAQTVAASHAKLIRKIGSNGNSLSGVKPQWEYSTMDWIQCIDFWGLPEMYKHPRWLPIRKSEWITILKNKMKAIYASELEDFLQSNGKVFTLVFGLDTLVQKHIKKPYQGFFEELKILYDGDITTTKIKQSIKVMINSTRLNWTSCDDLKNVITAVGDSPRKCPFCGLIRGKFAAFHLIWTCSAIPRNHKLRWNGELSFKRNISFLEGLQLRIDEL